MCDNCHCIGCDPAAQEDFDLFQTEPTQYELQLIMEHRLQKADEDPAYRLENPYDFYSPLDLPCPECGNVRGQTLHCEACTQWNSEDIPF